MDKFTEIEMSKIVPNADNDKVFSMKEIRLLADTIKEEGFFGGIEVFKLPGKDKYEISSGHRRYEAMKLLKRKTIPCIVSNYPSDYKRGIKMLTSNIRSRKLSPLDMARAIDYYDKLLSKEGLKKDFKNQAATFFNMSPIQVYRHQCLLRIIPELQELANDPQFPYSAFREAATLSKAGQKQLYNEITYFISSNEDNDEKEYKLTRARIEQLIGNIKEQEQQRKAKPKEPAYKIREDASVSYSPLNIPIAPEENLVVQPRTVATTNEYRKSPITINDIGEIIDDTEEDFEEDQILHISEKISSLEEDLLDLSDENRKKCIKMIKELISKYK